MGTAGAIRLASICAGGKCRTVNEPPDHRDGKPTGMTNSGRSRPCRERLRFVTEHEENLTIALLIDELESVETSAGGLGSLLRSREKGRQPPTECGESDEP
jgi:hypothetical protein